MALIKDENDKASLMHKKFNMNPFVVFPILAIGMIWAIGLSGGETTTQTQNTVEYAKVGANIQAPADMLLSREKDDFEKLMQVYRSNDVYGLDEMISTGQVIYIDAGTELLVIDRSITMTMVRVLSGPNTGYSGWAPFEMFSN